MIKGLSLCFRRLIGSDLDSKTGKEIMDIFLKLNQEGQTIVVITHEKEIANQTNRIITIKDGEVESDVSN